MKRTAFTLVGLIVVVSGIIAWLLGRGDRSPGANSPVAVIDAGSVTRATSRPVLATAVPPSSPAPRADAGRSVQSLDDDAEIRSDSFGADILAKFDREDRDHDWAPAAERKAMARLLDVPYVDRARDLYVTCAETICRMAFSSQTSLTSHNVNVMMRVVQSPDFIGQMRRDGLVPAIVTFTGKTGFQRVTLLYKRSGQE